MGCPFKTVVTKIMHPKLGVLSEYHLNVLVVAQDKQSIDIPIPWEFVAIPDITNDSLLHILRENGYAEPSCIEDIRICAGNDLSLAIMAADYYEKNSKNANDFIEIMDCRCDRLPSDKREIKKILGPLSIIDNYFSKDEASFFLDSSPQDKYEIEYLAEEYLQLAEEQLFIRGEDKFLFANERIKDYFKIKLEKKRDIITVNFRNFYKNIILKIITPGGNICL